MDTWRFRVYLSDAKAQDWINDIHHIIKRSGCQKKVLESTIGRLNHIGYIIPFGRYFLNRLRCRLQQSTDKYDYSRIHLLRWDIEDLKLWSRFITKANNQGVSINNLVHVQPTCVLFSDASTYGLGGYAHFGLAWRWKISTHLQHRASINLLEFITSAITIKMHLLYERKKGGQYPHLLAFSDSSSAVGWLYHSTFNPVADPMHDTVG